jgi:hypothetical protein
VHYLFSLYPLARLSRELFGESLYIACNRDIIIGDIVDVPRYKNAIHEGQH